MRIAESSVALSASHEAERSKTSEMTIESNFRQVFESLASTPDDSQQAALERVTSCSNHCLSRFWRQSKARKARKILPLAMPRQRKRFRRKGGEK